ncbi:MAG: rod shape-determining protein MreC [Xanthomonadales bacterium]|nr:rod shape-determining protein MreC [Xanthomonadales bacterium]
MMYLLMCVALMAMDYRGHYVPRIRSAIEAAFEPLYHLVGLPSRAVKTVTEYSRSYQQLLDENRNLSEVILQQSGSIQQLRALQEENLRLRALLEATSGRHFEFRFAEMVQVNLDPFSHKVIIDRGSRDGVFPGQAVLDGTGVMGQVADVHFGLSTVLLISDPDHALPVQIARTGLRTVAYGTGETATLLLPNVPQQADVRLDDLLVTSGLGDRFPPGFPVARVTTVDRDAGETFSVVRARPLAALDRGREVLLVIQRDADATGPKENMPGNNEPGQAAEDSQEATE